jgi:hypothetical protein
MAMATAELLERMGRTLGAMPGVFSTAQWGGRAYKLPGSGGSRRHPHLVAFVCCEKDGAIGVSFKLPRERAAQVTAIHDWLRPHPFRTLAPSGWVAARLSNRRQAGVLEKLLAESFALHEPLVARPPAGRGADAGAEARRLDRAMQDLREKGWAPADAGEP